MEDRRTGGPAYMEWYSVSHGKIRLCRRAVSPGWVLKQSRCIAPILQNKQTSNTLSYECKDRKTLYNFSKIWLRSNNSSLITTSWTLALKTLWSLWETNYTDADIALLFANSDKQGIISHWLPDKYYLKKSCLLNVKILNSDVCTCSDTQLVIELCILLSYGDKW